MSDPKAVGDLRDSKTLFQFVSHKDYKDLRLTAALYSAQGLDIEPQRKAIEKITRGINLKWILEDHLDILDKYRAASEIKDQHGVSGVPPLDLLRLNVHERIQNYYSANNKLTNTKEREAVMTVNDFPK